MRRAVGGLSATILLAIGLFLGSVMPAAANGFNTPSPRAGCSWTQIAYNAATPNAVYSTYDGTSGWINADVTMYGDYDNNLHGFCGDIVFRSSVWPTGQIYPRTYLTYNVNIRWWWNGNPQPPNVYSGSWYVNGGIAYWSNVHNIGLGQYIGADNLNSGAQGTISPSRVEPYAHFG